MAVTPFKKAFYAQLTNHTVTIHMPFTSVPDNQVSSFTSFLEWPTHTHTRKHKMQLAQQLCSRISNNTLHLRCSTLTFMILILISHCVSSCSSCKDGINSVLSLPEEERLNISAHNQTNWEKRGTYG